MWIGDAKLGKLGWGVTGSNRITFQYFDVGIMDDIVPGCHLLLAYGFGHKFEHGLSFGKRQTRGFFPLGCPRNIDVQKAPAGGKFPAEQDAKFPFYVKNRTAAPLV